MEGSQTSARDGMVGGASLLPPSGVMLVASPGSSPFLPHAAWAAPNAAADAVSRRSAPPLLIGFFFFAATRQDRQDSIKAAEIIGEIEASVNSGVHARS